MHKNGENAGTYLASHVKTHEVTTWGTLKQSDSVQNPVIGVKIRSWSNRTASRHISIHCPRSCSAARMH